MTTVASFPPTSSWEGLDGPEGRQEPECDNDREATEMGEYIGVPCGSSVHINSSTQRPHTSEAKAHRGYFRYAKESLAKSWQRQVSATVPHDACRDHLALERTFLGYLRTSLALSMVSVIIAQLFRLEHAQNPDKVLGYFVLGIPLARICIGAAIFVLLLGAFRFWRQQNAILRGKVHAGGWEMNTIGLTIVLVVLTLFVLLVTVDSRKDQ